MKTVFTLLTLCVLFAFCKKEDKPVPKNCLLVSGKLDDKISASSISYDANNRMVSYKTYFGDVYKFDYSNPAEIKELTSTGGVIQVYKLNENGLLELKTRPNWSDSSWYEYDNEGFLVKERSKYVSYEHVMLNGDRIRTYIDDVWIGKDTITYEYYPSVDPRFGAPGFLFRGKYYTHLLKSKTRTGENDEEHSAFTYKTNSQGFITEIHEVRTTSSGSYEETLGQSWGCK